MKSITCMAVGLAVAAGIAPAAMAQGKVELAVSGETDGGGAAASCALRIRLTNGGAGRITVFAGEVAAVDARSGAALRVNAGNVPFMGVAVGASKSWENIAVTGAPCEHVRLQVVSATCSPRCAPVEWTHQGLAGIAMGRP